MCGRYVVASPVDDLAEEFGVEMNEAHSIEESYNVAPTQESPVVLARTPRDAADGGEPVHQLRPLVWGLMPWWAKDRKVGNKMINARAETVAQKPAYRRAFAARRCLIPASGFFEWFPTGQVGRSGREVKQPFYIRYRSGDSLALAGVYELWRDPDTSEWLATYSVITTSATDDVGHLHDRMPMVVTVDEWPEWLDPHMTDTDRASELMAPPTTGSLESFPVSTAVNNVRNNGPELIAPIQL